MKIVKPKQLQRKLMLAAVAAACSAGQFAYANPVGPAVVSGQAAFASRGNQLSVTNTPGAIINWQQFSIQANETTRFIQQSAASAVLNRVVGVDPSLILGALQSNGRVFLINPNGILFGAGAQIDVAGLVASTLNLRNEDFLAGRMNFAGDPAQAAAIVNQGRISASPGGQVFLVGSAVDNQGVITAPNGDIVLAAGRSVRVTDSTSAGLQMEITAPADRALNLSEVTHGSRGIYAGLVRNSGVVNANSAVRGADGSIVLKASGDVTLAAGSSTTANGVNGGTVSVQSGGTTLVSGTIEAQGSQGTGGTVQVLGTQVGLLDNSTINVSGQTSGGYVMVGGDFHGANPNVQNATATYVSPTATINADAIQSGNGGNVTVWANDTTQFYGAISARGGSSNGNGGFVETSGKGWLDFQGLVDTRAPFGLAGTLLLDPTNITIDTTANTPTMAFGGGCGANTYCDVTTTPSNLNVGTLTGQLGLSNITVTTASGLGAVGDITVNTLISYNSGFNLNLAADRNITVSAGSGITNTGAGALTLTGGGAGSIAINENISTNGGTITLTSGSGGINLANAKSIDAGSGLISINAGAGPVNFGTGTLQTSNATAAAMTVTNATTLALGNVALTGGGTLSVSHSGAGLQNATTSISGTGALTKAGAGTLTLSGANTYTGFTTVSAGTLNLNATAGNSIAGDLTVSGGSAVLQQSDQVANTANVVVSVGTLDIGVNSDAVAGVQLLSGSITGTTGTLTSNSNFDLRLGTVSAILGGAVGVDKTTAGTVTLSGANTYTGATAVNAGVLNLQNATAAGTTAGGVTVANGAALELQGGIAVGDEALSIAGSGIGGNGALRSISGSNSWDGIVTLASAATIQSDANTLALGAANAVTGAAQDLTLGGAGNGAIGGTITTTTGALTKTGAGTWTLSGANTYTGTTTVNAGTLAYGASDVLATGAVTVSGATAVLALGANQSDTVGTVTVANGGSITGTGTSALTSTGTFEMQSGAVSAILAGAGIALNKTTAGTVTLSGANTYTGATAVNAGVLNLQNATAAGTTAGGVTVANGAALELQGGIAVGDEALSIAGSGIGGNGALRNISGNNSWGGTVTLAGAATIQSDANTLALGAANAVTGAAQDLTLGGAGNGTIGGTITTTTGALTKTGAGTWTLSGANLYTGTTTVNAGTLAYGASDVLAAGAVTVSGATAVLALGANQSDTVGTVTVANGGSITGTGTSTLTSTGTFEMQSGAVSAILAGAGIALNKTIAGTVTLSGVNTYTGVTTINAGVLSVGTIGNGGVAGNLGAATAAAGNLVLGGGTLQYTGATASTNRAFTLTAGTTSAISVTANNLTMSGAGAATTGALTKLGAGTLTLSGANLYTGTTTVNAGTLAYGASDVLATGAVTVSGATAVLALGANQSDTVGTVTVANGGSITGTGTSTLTSTGTFEMQSGAVSAILAGAGIALNKTTGGTVTLSGANTYSGLTTVSAGTLSLNTTAANSIAGNLTVSGGSAVLQQSDQIADTANVVVSGGTLDIGANNDTVAGVQLLSGSITGTTGTLTSTTDFDLQSGSVSAILGGNVGIIKTTPSTVTLSRNNTFTGATNVNAGTLAVSANNALGTAAQGTTVANGATLDFQNVNYTTTEAITVNGGTLATSTGTSTFAGPVTLGANSTVAVGGTQLTLSGVISEGSGGLGLDKTGTGTLVLSGVETYTGTTSVTAGTLALGASDRLDDVSNVVVNGTGTFSIAGFDETVAGVQLLSGSITGTTGTLTSLSDFDLQSGSVSAILGGAVGVDKTTAGVVTLSGSNTYTGATAVDAGTLVVSANNALGTVAAGTTVASGATLDLQNVIYSTTEAVTLNGNGAGSIGALTGTGTASLAGNVTLNTASTIGVTTGADSLTLGGTIEGPGALGLIGAGTVTLGGTAGSTTALASLTQSAATTLNLNGGLVRTAGDQTYDGSVTLGGATTLRTTANGDIAANGAITATAGTLTLDTSAGNATLTNVLNDFGAVQVTSGGAVSLVDANAMTLGASSMGAITARTLSLDLALGGDVTATGSGNSIVLVASRNFLNPGSKTLDPGATGRWLVYSTNPASDTRGGLAYNFKQYNATFGVTPVLGASNGFLYSVAPSVTPSLTGAATKVYDGTTAAALTPANYSFTGAIDGDTIALGNASSGTYDTEHVGAGKLVTVSGLTLAGASNGAATVYGYQLASTTANGNIGVITPAALTVTANSQSKTYGTTFTFTGGEFTPAGLQNGETIGSVTLTSAGTAPTAHVAGGPYAITASAATGGTFTPTDYTISYVDGTLTVNPAALTVTANNQVKAYGTPFTFAGNEFTSSALQNGETIGSVTLTSTGAPSTASVAGSPYPIVASAATGGTFTASDYAITYVNGSFTVNPAGIALTVTANDLSKTYGTALVFAGSEFSATGLQNAETIGSVTLTSAGAAAAPVAGGPYPITPSAATGGTFTPSNYTISYVNGALTVNPAPLTIQADNKSRLPNTANPLFTATYSGFQLGETPAALAGVLSFNTTATTASPIGNYPIVPSGQSSTNYAITYVDGTLAVLRPPVANGVTNPLFAELARLGIWDFSEEDCLDRNRATVKGVAAKTGRRCDAGDAKLIEIKSTSN